MLPGCVPWPKELGREYRRKGYWLDVSIPQMFARIADAAPGRLAVVDGDRRISLDTLWEQSGHLAAHFHKSWRCGRANAPCFNCRTASNSWSRFWPCCEPASFR